MCQSVKLFSFSEVSKIICAWNVSHEYFVRIVYDSFVVNSCKNVIILLHGFSSEMPMKTQISYFSFDKLDLKWKILSFFEEDE